MPRYIECDACGETYDDKGTPHMCPGSPDDRISALETEVSELREQLSSLLLQIAEIARYVKGTGT